MQQLFNPNVVNSSTQRYQVLDCLRVMKSSHETEKVVSETTQTANYIDIRAIMTS